MLPHYPELLALELDPVELAGCMVCRNVLAEVVEHLQIWRFVEAEISEASRLVTLSFARNIHWSWQNS